jgi:glycosyltransferase involved in cell wall biosynthesis
MSTPSRSQLGVVVIGRNEGPRLRRCLESAWREVERVVYVDSGSVDDSVGVARELGVEVVQLDPEQPFGAGRARNEGVARLRQLHPDVTFVQFIDGDCELSVTWIDAALAAMAEDEQVAVVCGRRWERYPRLSPYNRLCDMEWDTPVGEARACGGDALMRLSAFDEAGGFDATLVAGEEPELCVRLRGLSWVILRIDCDMTIHDARMTRFSQWFRRAVRCGYAYAEGRARHGRSPERFRVREVRSALFFGAVVPLAALGLAPWTSGASLLLLAAHLLLFLRVRRQRLARVDDPAGASLYARACVVAKLAQTLGLARFALDRALKRRARIIEYNEAPRAATNEPGAAPGWHCHVLYVGGRLPGRSATFVYREVFGLRERGRRVTVASIHPPERDLGDDRLEALAREAVPVYGSGVRALLGDCLRAVRAEPALGLAVLRRALSDAISGRDLSLARRPRAVWQAMAGLALAQRVRHLGIGHVHAHMAHVPATVGMYAAMYLCATFSFTGHAVDLFAQRTMLYQKLRRALFVPCISLWHRAFYQRIVGRSGSDLPIVRCGVDLEEFSPAATAGAAGAVCRVVAVGRLVPKKGFDLLIEAVGMLVREGLDLRCRILGEGPEMATLRRLRIEHGVARQVELQGAASNAAVRRELADADLFVLPCRVDASGDRDGIPVALVEAMACGVCAVSGDLVTIRELIDHDRSGVLVRPGSAAQLAGALRRLIQDPQRRAELARAGRRRVEEEFSLQHNLDRLAAVLARALGDAAAPVAPAPGALEAEEAAPRAAA